jgi:hypothetical protein
MALTTDPHSNVEVKERVELYLFSPFGSSWPVLGRNLPTIIYSYQMTSPFCCSYFYCGCDIYLPVLSLCAWGSVVVKALRY